MRRPPLGPCWWTLVAGAVISIGVMVVGDLRLGGYLLAGTLGLGAIMRLVLPDTVLGGVVVRGRATDAVMYLVLAAVLVTTFTVLKPGEPGSATNATAQQRAGYEALPAS